MIGYTPPAAQVPAPEWFDEHKTQLLGSLAVLVLLCVCVAVVALACKTKGRDRKLLRRQSSSLDSLGGGETKKSRGGFSRFFNKRGRSLSVRSCALACLPVA